MSFECPICLEAFNNKIPNKIPKLLKCGDTLCVKCLRDLYLSEKIVCPICQKEINEIFEDIRINNYVLYDNNNIICDLCLKEYTNSFNSVYTPKTLKCGDTLCLKCLEKYYKNNEITCPICRKKKQRKIGRNPCE